MQKELIKIFKNKKPKMLKKFNNYTLFKEYNYDFNETEFNEFLFLNIDKNFYHFILKDNKNQIVMKMDVFENEILKIHNFLVNKTETENYLSFLIPWFQENNFSIDLNQYNIIYNQNDGKTYSVFEIPDNCTIFGNLSINDRKLEYLPNNLKVIGNLSLRNCWNLKLIPTDLNCIGDLDLSYCFNLKSLPDNLTVYGDLDLSFSNIKKINNINIYGDLNLSFSKIKELSQNIMIGKNLNLTLSLIEKLPDNLTINGNLDLSHCTKLKKIPNQSVVKGNLILINTNFLDIPYDMEIQKEIIFYESQLKKSTNFDLIKNNP